MALSPHRFLVVVIAVAALHLMSQILAAFIAPAPVTLKPSHLHQRGVAVALRVLRHTVKKGGTLHPIAEKCYKKGYLWRPIASANNSKDPDRIYPGQVVRIPGPVGVLREFFRKK